MTSLSSSFSSVQLQTLRTDLCFSRTNEDKSESFCEGFNESQCFLFGSRLLEWLNPKPLNPDPEAAGDAVSF